MSHSGIRFLLWDFSLLMIVMDRVLIKNEAASVLYGSNKYREHAARKGLAR